jgi:hypothetical protein
MTLVLLPSQMFARRPSWYFDDRVLKSRYGVFVRDMVIRLNVHEYQSLGSNLLQTHSHGQGNTSSLENDNMWHVCLFRSLVID